MDYFDILLAKKLEDDRDPKVEGLSVTENGRYHEDGVVYDPVIVALPLDKKTITANGTYKASDDDLEGYNEVEVEVPMPANAYLKKSAESYPIAPSLYPLPKAEVTFSGNKAELYVGSEPIVVAEDNAPYVYRQSPQNKSAVDVSLVGGTIAWNQLVDTTDTSCTVPNAHKYIFHHGTTYDVAISDGTAFTVDGSANDNVYDLTQAFGSTIADAIYTMEQATAGSGIAWLKSYGYLTKDYYAYQSGKLESVNVASRKVVGRNLCPKNEGTINVGDFVVWNEPLPSGTYSISLKANRTPSNNSYASLVVYDKNGLAYSSAVGIASADLNGTTIVKREGISFNNGISKIYAYSLAGNWSDSRNYTLNISELQIEIGSTATAYEPYKEVSYPLDSDLTLRGIPKLDANNNLYYDGDIYKSDGSVTRRFGVLDLSTAQAEYNSGWGCWVIQSISGAKIVDSNNSAPNVISNILTPTKASGYTSSHSTNTIAQNTSGIWFFDNGSSTTKSGILLYELATPTSETADAFINPQLVGSTEEFVDATSRDVMIPCGQDSNYANSDIYISYGTSPIDMAKEHSIVPYTSTYIDSNGSEDVEYWEEVVS